MATINLGKVKGEPFRYEDFTEEQLEALKGKDFKYEDFSPEQLEGLKSKVKIGTVETLDADQKATVTSSVDGNVTTLNIGIPRGNGVNSYSGTREEYNNIADTIKDGSLVNITDENDFDDENLIGQVTMQRLNDIEDNFDKIKPHALTNPTNNLLATEPGTALDAVQGKALNEKISKVNISRMGSKQYSTLESLVEDTASEIYVPHYFRFKDIGGFVMGIPNAWYRMLVCYQNTYNESTTYSVGGTGLLWDSNNVYKIFIDGTKTTGVSLTLEKLVTESELNNGLTSIKVYNNTDFQTVADSVPINKKLTCRMLGSGNSPVTGLPASQLFIVEIYAISEVTAIATAYAAESGNMYINRKSSGNWQGWVKKTNTVS